MSEPKIGELFAGYGGLGMGVQAALGGDIAWVSEYDKGPSKILAHRFPGVPNHGDITKIQWVPTCGAYEFEGCGQKTEVLPDRSGWQCHRCQKLWPTSLGKVYWPEVPEPVDILTGGSPCQDLSHAGARKGMSEGTRSNLWVAMREAIAQLKPSLVVWENVGGAFSANADSEVEPCPGCVGDGTGVHLRALGRVLGDLASLGFDAEWTALRAADVGAPHGRLRVFVVAYPAGSGGREGGRVTDGVASDRRRSSAVPDERGRGALLPSPRTSDTNGAGQHGTGGLDLRTAVSLLPTPAVNDMGASYTPDEWDAWTDRMKAQHGNGNGHGKSLHIEAARLLPSPSANDGNGGRQRSREALERGDHQANLTDAPRLMDMHWGQYAAAIQRWESLTRPAPAPTETGPKGNPRLSAAFSEWMMGLPAGWVTDVPGITRNEALKALGNGVCPPQCTAALRMLLGQPVSA